MSELDKHLLFQTSFGVLKEQNSQKEIKPQGRVERPAGKLSMAKEKTQKANNEKLVVSKK